MSPACVEDRQLRRTPGKYANNQSLEFRQHEIVSHAFVWFVRDVTSTAGCDIEHSSMTRTELYFALNSRDDAHPRPENHSRQSILTLKGSSDPIFCLCSVFAAREMTTNLASLSLDDHALGPSTVFLMTHLRESHTFESNWIYIDDIRPGSRRESPSYYDRCTSSWAWDRTRL